jgi:hypothetical protein
MAGEVKWQRHNKGGHVATVRLDFIPPASPDIVELRIYESPTKDGIFEEIEVVTAVGEYPNYISTYTTTAATAIDYWFSIDWYDNKGGHLGQSDPIQGNVQLLLGEIVGRALTRDPTINENVVYDEAQAVLEGFLPQGTDVEDASIEMANYRERSGLTLLTMARCYVFEISEGEEEYTVGLVSQKVKNSRSMDLIEGLLRRAEAELGISYSAILQMTEIEVAGGRELEGTVDLTRLLIELQ